MADVSVLFSGGPDSTLAALRGLDEFSRVHLLTFHHRLMSRMGRHTVVTKELRRVYGSERVLEYGEDIDTLLKKCYFTGQSKLIARYRTFYVPWVCGACKMAMHLRAISYNMEHGVTTTYDGANIESAPYFPDQTQGYIEVMKEFYGLYGMRYECPVYYINGTDNRTEDYGILSTKKTKKEHVLFSTQHSCPVGLAVHLHARLWYVPFRGKERMCGLAGGFLTQMIGSCKSVLPEVGP